MLCWTVLDIICDDFPQNIPFIWVCWINVVWSIVSRHIVRNLSSLMMMIIIIIIIIISSSSSSLRFILPRIKCTFSCFTKVLQNKTSIYNFWDIFQLNVNLFCQNSPSLFKRPKTHSTGFLASLNKLLNITLHHLNNDHILSNNMESVDRQGHQLKSWVIFQFLGLTS